MTTEKKKRKECEAEGCTIVPVFNYNNESSGRFCKAHRHALSASATFPLQDVVPSDADKTLSIILPGVGQF